MFLMYRIHPYYCFFALQLPSWTNLKIENRHVHIFRTSCLYVSYLSTCMYISTYYISCSKKCLHTIPIQLHNLLLQSFLLFFPFSLSFCLCFFFFFFWSINSKCCIWNCLVSLRSYYKSYVLKRRKQQYHFSLLCEWAIEMTQLSYCLIDMTRIRFWDTWDLYVQCFGCMLWM